MRESDRAVFWRNHVDAFRQQGGLQSDYCRQHGLTPRELRKWRTRFYGPARGKRSSRTEDLRSQSGLSEFSYAPEVLAKCVEAAPGRPVVRRRWSDDEKRQLVWDALNSGQSLSQFAKRLHIHPSVMHRWLCTLTRPVLADPPSAELGFADVRIAEPPTTVRALSGPANPAGGELGTGAIEIVLANRRLVRVGAGVDPDALRRVIAVLESVA